MKTFEPLTFGSHLRKLVDKLILFDAKMLEPLTSVSLLGKSRWFNYFFGAFYSYFGEKVLSVKLKIFLQTKTEIFSQFNEAITIIH